MDKYERSNKPRDVIPPVAEGDKVLVKIEALGEKGDGIAKINKFIIFVPHTQVNDNIKIRITKVMNKFAFGEVI